MQKFSPVTPRPAPAQTAVTAAPAAERGLTLIQTMVALLVVGIAIGLVARHFAG